MHNGEKKRIGIMECLLPMSTRSMSAQMHSGNVKPSVKLWEILRIFRISDMHIHLLRYYTVKKGIDNDRNLWKSKGWVPERGHNGWDKELTEAMQTKNTCQRLAQEGSPALQHAFLLCQVPFE